MRMEINQTKEAEKTENGKEFRKLFPDSANKSSRNVSAKKTTSGQRGFGENGFEEQGGYMEAKKSKLENQFNKSDRFDSETNIFNGISVHINGYTDPPEPELRELFIRHGGLFHPYNNSSTTYVIATNMSAPSKRLHGSKAVKPAWIMDSIAASKALDIRNYKLYNLNQEKQQMTLSQVVGLKKAAPENPLGHGANSDGNIEDRLLNTGHDVKIVKDNSQQVSDSEEIDEEEEFFECSQEIYESPPRNSFQVNNNDAKHVNVPEEDTTAKNIRSTECDKIVSDKLLISNSTNEMDTDHCIEMQEPSVAKNASSEKIPSPLKANDSSPTNTAGRIKTAADEGYLKDFFSNSRLHLISEQKKDMQLLIANMRKNLESHTVSNLTKFESEFVPEDNSNDSFRFSNNEVVLMHVDLDCFFASVGLLTRPHLRGKPVVVTHSSGKMQDSRSDIACASYEARKFGVKNGMWVGDAKAMCPELEVIQYNFEEYKRISKLFFEAVATFTLDIEPCSVDEMVVDVSSILRRVPLATPTKLAEFMRKIILDGTNCPASVGIGSNRLLAKLAVKLAKPNGVHHLKDSDAAAHIENLQIRDLPGVGWSNEEKLRERLNIHTCGDLLKVQLKDLKAVLGEKTSEKMHNLCRGIDTSEIKLGLDRPKSLSVDVNFGIRFTKEEDVNNFLISICKEVGTRAEKVQALSTQFTLKLLIRKKGAGIPLKHGGHGIVDSITRSRNLFTPSRNWQEFYKVACSLLRTTRVPPSDFRGIGVTLTDLTFDCDKSNKKPIQRTLTDMPISRAHKMLTISQKKKKQIDMPTNATTELETSLDSDDSNSVKCPESINKEDSPVVTPDPKLPVDIQMLRQLPRQIAEEQCRLYGISVDILKNFETSSNPLPCSSSKEVVNEQGNGKAVAATVVSGTDCADYYDLVDSVDQSFLQALPENVRQDVLIHLQEAQGRKAKGSASATEIQDKQQPCSSRQAIAMESTEKKLEHGSTLKDGSTSVEKEEDSFKTTAQPSTPPNKTTLHEQTTPIISYSKKGFAAQPFSYENFWDESIDYLPTSPKPIPVPALNNQSDIGVIRELIRQGLEVVVDPSDNDVANLEKFFHELITKGWIQQCHVLLKFLYRRASQLQENSKWTPILTKIIADTQRSCWRLYHGVLELDTHDK